MRIKTFSDMNFNFSNKKSSEFALERKIVRFAWRQQHGSRQVVFSDERCSGGKSGKCVAGVFSSSSHTPKNLIKNTSPLTDMMKHFSSYRNATKSEGTGRSKFMKELINRGWMLPNYVGICVAARWRWQVVLQYNSTFGGREGLLKSQYNFGIFCLIGSPSNSATFGGGKDS